MKYLIIKKTIKSAKIKLKLMCKLWKLLKSCYRMRGGRSISQKSVKINFQSSKSEQKHVTSPEPHNEVSFPLTWLKN